MPAPVYTHSRRRLLLVAMVGVLGGTFALAAGVRHAKLVSAGVALTQKVDLGAVTARLPTNWVAEVTSSNGWPFSGKSMTARAVEFVNGEARRATQIHVERAADGVSSADDYLRLRYLRGRIPAGGTLPIAFAGRDGVRATIVNVGTKTAQATADHYACVMLPDRFVVTVHVQVPGDEAPGRGDKLLVELVDGIRVKGTADLGGY